MNDREKLVELLKGSLPHFMNDIAYWQDEHVAELADHLLSHGVTIREPGQEGGWSIKGSECHYILGHVFKAKNRCPYCGAPMKGKANEH